ncbi:DUF2177 family protein [Ochrobactrum sp. MYb379]|uniref:DUF2177 family protein n=1 Tax=Ochrobactrum sp. MYb379 TaxID=2745275 RepID=UPI003098B133
MKRIFVSYKVTHIVFVAIDFTWLSTMAGSLYQVVMGNMLITDFRLAPAIAFYLLNVIGLTFLAVTPRLEKGSPPWAEFRGAVLGFTAYATYDLTNQATLKKRSTMLTIADLVWGTILSAAAAATGCLIAIRIFGCGESPISGTSR